MARQEDNKNNFKKILKGALGVGAAYLAVKNPDGALQVAGGLAEDALKEREELIKVRGEELAADKAYYRQRADIAYANKTAQYETDFAATNKLDKALSSLVSASASNGASKRDIAMNVLVAKGIIPNTGTKIDDTSGIALQLNTEINKLKDVVGEDGKVTGYTYEGTAVPNRPDYKDYFNSSKIQVAQASIADNSFSTMSQKLFGKDDTGDAALATLQRDMDSGYQEVLESDLSGKSKQYQFKAGKGSDSSKIDEQVLVIHRGTGETIDLQVPNFRDGRENAIFKQIQITYDKDRDDRSTDFRNIVNDNIVANIPGIEIQQFMTVGTDGKVSGVKPAASALVNRISSLQLEIVEANYHTAGWTTQNPEDNSTGALISRLNTEVNRRILPISSNFKFFKIDIPDIGTPIEGQYVIPTSIIPLYENIPAQVKNSNGELVNTMPYLQQELEKIVEVEGENKKATLSNIYNILDKRTAEILKPVQSEEIKKDIPIVSEDGNTFTIGEQSYSFEKLDERLLQLDDKEKSKISESIMEAYNLWKKNQEKESSEVTIEKQMEEVIPDISKMQLGTVIEKDLVTAEYLNSYTKDVSFTGKEEFYAGNNMMLNIGDEVTTKDGIKYESYVDTTTDNQGREISTLKFKPITIE